MQSSNRRSTDWSKLPSEILRSIAKLVQQNSNNNEYRNFRAVCKNWCRSTSISVLLPFCDYKTPSYTLFSSSILMLRPADSAVERTPWMVSAVEMDKGNPRLCHPFFRTPLSNVPQNLNLGQLKSTCVAVSYHLARFDDRCCCSALSGFDKVLLVSTESLPSIDECSLLVLHHGRLGGYPSVEEEPAWVDVTYRGVSEFDDVVCFKGRVYVVDWAGKLYQIASDRVAVRKVVVSGAVSSDGAFIGWRKRLVVSSIDQGLYLVVRSEKHRLKVYKLNNHGKILTWSVVQGFEGDGGQVLFLSKVYGFFVAAKEFPGRQLSNCIVFSEDAFPVYSFRGWMSHVDAKAEEDIRIFRIGVHDDDRSNFLPVLSDPNFPIALWSAPTKILQPQTPIPRFQFHSERRIFRGGEMQLDQEHRFIRQPKSTAFGTEISTDPVVQTASVTPSPDHTAVQPVNGASTLKVPFQGIDVNPDHQSVLQKVWMKHGDAVKGSIIRSRDFTATAMASLAKLILILQTNTGKTLTDDQVHYLSSTLVDLQSMQVNVEWLVPAVEKAFALHKRKALDAALAELEQAKAKVEEMKMKFHREMTRMKEGFSSDTSQPVSMITPASVPIDTDKCLGEGLL